MGPDFDEGSLKKARSFLLVFSSLLLALWYFKADLNTVSILGNSIKLTRNTENFWAVLALINCYFFFRFIQHLPSDWSTQGERVDRFFKDSLIRTSKYIYKKDNYKSAYEKLQADPDHAHVKDFHLKVDGDYFRPEYNSETGTIEDNNKRYELLFNLFVQYEGAGGLHSISGWSNRVKPSKFIILYSNIVAFIKGIFLSPWFTENVFPMLWALFSIAVSVFNWWITAKP
ncbi:hypothetical protein [Pseudomonas luteola]|uniref:SMODS and SLOG-associating 2TM effector domain-containing protein n=1 Tax=Pseudomonas luteola TaxID=47886 RepID=A0ABS0FIG0_PSELU|nr:hypothetical protein [Pseudomonas zeshuii]MBF8640120.1 hypothetical protein [Pseudomonas zeshuii]